MKFLRFAVIAAALSLIAFCAVSSPLAHVHPAAAVVVAGGLAWGALLLISPVDRTVLPAISAASSLKLDRILELTLRAFKVRLAPLRMFSTAFQANPIPLDNFIRVPYVSLESMDSQDWDPVLGYGEGDFTVTQIPVQITKRKYQPLTFTSDQLRGLPIDVLAEAMMQKTDKLVVDVTTDIMSVITNANFGAAIFTGAASGFDSDDLPDIRKALTDAYWPDAGRNLILDSDYTTALAKDDALKLALNSGTTQTLREGVIGRLSGMDITEVPNFPANGENLVGIAALKYGILIGSAPIEPGEEVRSQLSDYRVVTDDQTGLTLTYKAWGNADFDLAKRIIEFSYGYAKGDTQQIKRLVSA